MEKLRNASLGDALKQGSTSKTGSSFLQPEIMLTQTSMQTDKKGNFIY